MLISAFILVLEILLQGRYRAEMVVRIHSNGVICELKMPNAVVPDGKFATNCNDA
jgi:hypothetical protein